MFQLDLGMSPEQETNETIKTVAGTTGDDTSVANAKDNILHGA